MKGKKLFAMLLASVMACSVFSGCSGGGGSSSGSGSSAAEESAAAEESGESGEDSQAEAGSTGETGSVSFQTPTQSLNWSLALLPTASSLSFFLQVKA